MSLKIAKDVVAARNWEGEKTGWRRRRWRWALILRKGEEVEDALAMPNGGMGSLSTKNILLVAANIRPTYISRFFSFFGISFRDFDVSKMAILRIKMRQLRYILKMGEARPLFVYFRSFLTSKGQTNLTIIDKRWCAWESNPGQQDGRQRWLHWAMAAPMALRYIPWFYFQMKVNIIHLMYCIVRELRDCQAKLFVLLNFNI